MSALESHDEQIVQLPVDLVDSSDEGWDPKEARGAFTSVRVSGSLMPSSSASSPAVRESSSCFSLSSDSATFSSWVLCCCR